MQSDMKVFWAGKLLYMIVFKIDGRYTKIHTFPLFRSLLLFSIIFFTSLILLLSHQNKPN
jgi:hypothetical protein